MARDESAPGDRVAKRLSGTFRDITNNTGSGNDDVDGSVGMADGAKAAATKTATATATAPAAVSAALDPPASRRSGSFARKSEILEEAGAAQRELDSVLGAVQRSVGELLHGEDAASCECWRQLRQKEHEYASERFDALDAAARAHFLELLLSMQSLEDLEKFSSSAELHGQEQAALKAQHKASKETVKELTHEVQCAAQMLGEDLATLEAAVGADKAELKALINEVASLRGGGAVIAVGDGSQEQARGGHTHSREDLDILDAELELRTLLEEEALLAKRIGRMEQTLEEVAGAQNIAQQLRGTVGQSRQVADKGGAVQGSVGSSLLEAGASLAAAGASACATGRELLMSGLQNQLFADLPVSVQQTGNGFVFTFHVRACAPPNACHSSPAAVGGVGGDGDESRDPSVEVTLDPCTRLVSTVQACEQSRMHSVVPDFEEGQWAGMSATTVLSELRRRFLVNIHRHALLARLGKAFPSVRFQLLPHDGLAIEWPGAVLLRLCCGVDWPLDQRHQHRHNHHWQAQEHDDVLAHAHPHQEQPCGRQAWRFESLELMSSLGGTRKGTVSTQRGGRGGEGANGGTGGGDSKLEQKIAAMLEKWCSLEDLVTPIEQCIRHHLMSQD